MTRACLRATLLVLCLTSQPTLADDFGWPRADEATDYLSGELMAQARPHWTAAPITPGAAALGFLFWPAMSIGTVLDTNPYQTTQGRSHAGVFIAPHGIVERDSGVHSTIGYAALNLSVFPEDTRANRYEGRVGVLHDWAFSRDMLLRLQADVQRRIDPLDRIGTASAGAGLVTRSDLRTTASLQQTWSSLFLLVSGEMLRSALSTDGDARRRSALSDSTVLSGAARLGSRVGPDLVIFGEGAASWRVLDSGTGSDSQRVVAGLGSDRIGLLHGEVFAGWQVQTTRGERTTLAGPVAGGRIGWSPRPDWVLAFEADQHLGNATVGTIVDPLGTPTRESEAALSARFTPTALWTGTAALGLRSIDYAGTARHDRLLYASASLDYLWRPGVDLVASVEVADLRSSLSGFSYARAVGRLGATYSY